MLMNIDCSIIQSLKVALTFDNNQMKEREISVGDLCYFEFNKNGKRKTIEGKVIKINVNSATDTSSWFIVVDGSLDYAGQMERFCPNQILDCEIIQHHNSVQYISTPNDSSRISMVRMVNGYLQISTDGGYSWMTPKNVKYMFEPESNEYIEEESGTPVSKPKKKKKPVIIEEDDEEEDVDTSTDTSDEDDEDVIEDETY